MRKLTSLLLLAALLLSGCGKSTPAPETTDALPDPATFLPSLTVEDCEAQIGSYNWEIDNGDGTSTGICVDAVHPLDILDQLPMLEANTREVSLRFSSTPGSILAWCWEDSAEDAQSATVEDGVLSLNPGTCVYQITATWPGSSGFDGIVHYSFRASAPADA